MRRHYRALALAIAITASTLASAQTSRGPSNPVGRGGGDADVFYYGPLNPRGQTFDRGPLDNTGIGRPNPRGQHQVTPVPEPSQWAMMLAGLALVGFIVRRNARSSRDQ